MKYNEPRYQELLTKFRVKGEKLTEAESKEWQDMNMEILVEMMGANADVFKRLKDR